MERIQYQEMILLVVTATIITRVSSLKITRLTMPRWVENGTEESVVLDCEYDLSDSDSRIVVKWFLNDDPEPIYQWIPELHSRHASKRIQGRLNWDYTVSPSNAYTKYRALNIIRPTTELSGRYSCHVMSLTGQDSEDQVMIIYAPPKYFEFNFTKTSNDVTNFTCEADGVYPLPRLLLYRNTPDNLDSQLITGTKVATNKKNGAYSARLSRLIRDQDLRDDSSTLFQCVLLIPGTNYKSQRSLYYPGGSFINTGCLCNDCSLLLNIISILLLMFQ